MMTPPDGGPRSIPARATDLVPAYSPQTSPRFERSASPAPATPSRKISARLVWRACRRHWWQAVALWIAGTSTLVVLAYCHVKPTYDAFSQIKVDPGERGLFVRDHATVDFETFKETQVKRLTNPNVIATALAAHPDLLMMPRLSKAQDAETEIRRSLNVGIIPRTHLIQVSMSSESAEEAAAVVNAMIEAYLKVALDSNDEETQKRCNRLREVKEERTDAVRQKRAAIVSLVKRIGPVDNIQTRDRDSLKIDQYATLSNQLLATELELDGAQALLERLKQDSKDLPKADPLIPDGELVAAFYATPQVAEVQGRLVKARQAFFDAERIARNSGDPATLREKKKVEEIQKQLDTLWARLKPALIKAGTSRAGAFRNAEMKVVELKSRKTQLEVRLGQFNEQSKADGTEKLTLEFARQDLSKAEVVLDNVTQILDQVEHEAKDPVARFRQEYKAKASNAPLANHQLKAMAAAPLGMLLGVLGLVVMVELHAGRVHDPEDLPDRLKIPVLGVVPPLPRPKDARARHPDRDGIRARRDLDQFVQSLDHLRVAICSGSASRGRARRSVLITSACGSEGKTTLAAQLAERCVNAGLLTLLIDADIRHPSLSRMFDLTSAQGLVNVLRGEARAEEAITVINNAGGFHFLPAGSPRVDPSRLLHDHRLSKLLAGARESFDIVIVDAPPVLPVPDALTIGRWVDGAVLAVRFDNSRYPLVDRANRRLAAVGVPVIGAVVNGFGGLDGSYYGGYHSAYGSLDDVE